MYLLDIKPELKKKLIKLAKKNKKLAKIIAKKTRKILQNPHRYKNLQVPLQNLKRVHIDKHFVLTFSIDEKKKSVVLEDFDHHDNIYKN